MAAITLGGMYAIGGVVESGNPAIDPDNSWKIATQYHLSHTYPLEAAYPKHDEAGPMARFKWANTFSEYSAYVVSKFGQPPFRDTLFQSPESAFLGGGGKTQTYTKTAVAGLSGYWRYTQPDDFGKVTWPDAAQGETASFSVLREDSAGDFFIFSWAATCDDSKWKCGDASAPDETGDGSFANPFKTYQQFYNLASASNFLFWFAAGDYDIHNGTPGVNASISSTSGATYVAEPGTNFILDNGSFTGGRDDMYFENVNLKGGRGGVANFKAMQWTTQTNRSTYVGVTAQDTPTGDISTQDNPSVIAYWGVGGATPHRDVVLRNCSMDDSCRSPMLITFTCASISVENCHGFNLYMPAQNIEGTDRYVGMFMNFKDASSSICMRFCTVSGYTDNGFVNFANQTPEYADKQCFEYNFLDYTGNSQFGALIWNQNGGSPQYKGTNQYAQKNTIICDEPSAAATYSNGVGGEKLNTSANAFKSDQAAFGGADGSQEFGVSNVRVTSFENDGSFTGADLAANAGYRGYQIISTAVS